MPPPHAHDSLFKFTFSNLRRARTWLRSALPASISKQIDWKTFRRESGSFVDEKFAHQHSDLLFSVCIQGRKAFIWILFEHQSTLPKKIPFRLLRYMVRIWDNFEEKHPDWTHLPVILPVVFYHGAQPWVPEISMLSLMDMEGVDASSLAPYVPQFSYVLDDVTKLTDEHLLERTMDAFVLLAMAMFRDFRTGRVDRTRLTIWIREHHAQFEKVLQAPNARRAFEALLWYLLCVLASKTRPNEILKVVHQELKHLPQAETTMMTIADALRKEGEKKGREEGLIVGQRTLVLKLLTLRFHTLPASIIERVQCANQKQLERWSEQILTAPSLDTMFGTIVSTSKKH